MTTGYKCCEDQRQGAGSEDTRREATAAFHLSYDQLEDIDSRSHALNMCHTHFMLGKLFGPDPERETAGAIAEPIPVEPVAVAGPLDRAGWESVRRKLNMEKEPNKTKAWSKGRDGLSDGDLFDIGAGQTEGK